MKERFVFALIMGMITTAVISFVLLAINLGITDRFWLKWGRSWLISYTLAVLAMLFVAPRIQLLVKKLVNNDR